MSSGINIGSVFTSGIGAIFGGPIGALAAQLAKQVMASIVDKVIEQLPIDQSFKDLLQAGFHAGLGDYQGAVQNAHEFIAEVTEDAGFSFAQTADMQRAAAALEQETRGWLEPLVEQIINSADDNEGTDGPVSSSGRRGDGAGWLRALAEALGKKVDELAHDMAKKADAIDEEDPSTVVDFQMASQRFQIVMNSASTALKAVGEGMTAASRKQ
jgi:hypothetical protein